LGRDFQGFGHRNRRTGSCQSICLTKVDGFKFPERGVGRFLLVCGCNSVHSKFEPINCFTWPRNSSIGYIQMWLDLFSKDT